MSKMYFFEEVGSGTKIVFTTEEKARTFRKAFKCWLIDNNYEDVIEEGEDYYFDEIPIDVPFEAWVENADFE